ncbi:MAG: hypothetical protein JXB39_17070 [Deltaproteobacteria bacterium]|nr:hypothetical protein [Deltaproteobacteria bacterium]
MAKKDGPAGPRLTTELEAIEKWSADEQDRLRKRLSGLDEEEGKFRQQLALIDKKLQENLDQRKKVAEELQRIPKAVLDRQHEALLRSVQAEREMVAARAGALGALQEARQKEIQGLLEDPANKEAIEEYEKFREVEPMLATLPGGYRRVLLDHHEEIKKVLEPVFAALEGPLPKVDGEVVEVAIVGSIDPVGGVPAAIAFVFPVGYEVCRSWSERPEDLSALLAYRGLGAICGALGEVNAADAPLSWRESDGALSVEILLADYKVGPEIKQAMEAALLSAYARAHEFTAARVAVRLFWVDPDVLVPEEAGDGDGVDQPLPGISKPVQVVLRRGGSSEW